MHLTGLGTVGELTITLVHPRFFDLILSIKLIHSLLSSLHSSVLLRVVTVRPSHTIQLPLPLDGVQSD